MLSERLKELEKLKLIEKKIYSTWPLKITYRLTKKGKSFYKIIKAMEEWGKKY
jgi:DNA-binding HxlR family transcriptional regulator